MPEKRGLFKKIFKKSNQAGNATRYQLLNSYQSSFVPFSGRAYDVNTVRAAVDSFARRAATVKPRHIHRRNGKIEDATNGFNEILQFKPNPYTTAYKFYYRLATQYKVFHNAFAYPVWNELTGKLEAIYNINANRIDLIEYEGEMYCKMTFSNGNVYVCAYADLIHIGTHFNENDVFGDNNEPIITVLETADTFNQSMSKFAELIAVVRGILKVQASTKSEDLKARRDEFIKDNLKMENNGAGVIVTDTKYDYTPINDKQTPIPTGQLSYVKNEIYDYYGTNEKIVQNKATPDEEEAFYEGEIRPFYVQLEQALTNCLLSRKERGFGNEIIAEGNKLQYAKLPDKLAAVKYLSEMGALEYDQALTTLGFPPIGGEEGKRRVQTLNMVNAQKADEYQLGGKTDPPKNSNEANPGNEPKEE